MNGETARPVWGVEGHERGQARVDDWAMPTVPATSGTETTDPGTNEVTPPQVSAEAVVSPNIIDADDIRLPNGPHFKERMNLAFEKRSTDFKVWAHTLMDRGSKTGQTALADDITVRIAGLKTSLRTEKERLSELKIALRELKHDDSALTATLSATPVGAWIQGKRAARLSGKISSAEETVRQMNAALAQRASDLEDARAKQAHFDSRIAATARQLQEPLKQKMVPHEMALIQVNQLIEKLGSEATILETKVTDHTRNAAAFKLRLKSQAMDQATETACETELDRLNDELAEARSGLKSKRAVLDRAFRHQSRLESAVRTTGGAVQALDIRYGRTTQDVARVAVSRDAEAALRAAREVVGTTPSPETPPTQQAETVADVTTRPATAPRTRRSSLVQESGPAAPHPDLGRFIPLTGEYAPESVATEAPKKGRLERFWDWVFGKKKNETAPTNPQQGI